MTTDELTKILESNIKFIKSCEKKVSIILLIFGVVLTLFFVSDNMKHIYGEVKNSLFLTIIAGLILLYLAYGVWSLVRLLFANDEYDRFATNIKYCNDNAFQDDLIDQISANLKICQEKFKNYIYGLKQTLYAFILFILFSVYITIF